MLIFRHNKPVSSQILLKISAVETTEKSATEETFFVVLIILCFFNFDVFSFFAFCSVHKVQVIVHGCIVLNLFMQLPCHIHDRTVMFLLFSCFVIFLNFIVF